MNSRRGGQFLNGESTALDFQRGAFRSGGIAYVAAPENGNRENASLAFSLYKSGRNYEAKENGQAQ